MASEKELCDLIKFMKDNDVKIDELKLLISEAADYQKKLSEIELYCNANEQYNRNWSIRVFGVEVPKSLIVSSGTDGACMLQVYNRLIHPVLSKKLSYVPECFDLLSNGHFVGEKKGNLPRTIIIRFNSRYYRNLFLGAKFDYLPKPTAAEVTKGIRYFACYPDLTARNHSYLIGLKSDSRTKSCWAFDGSLRFVLDGDSSRNVHFVDDLRISPTECIDKAVNCEQRRSRSESPPRRQTRASAGRVSNGPDRPKSQDSDPGRFNQRGRGGFARGNDHGSRGRGLGVRGGRGTAHVGRGAAHGGRGAAHGGRGAAHGGRGADQGGRGLLRGGRDQFQGTARGKGKFDQGASANHGVFESPAPKYPEHTGYSQKAGSSGNGQDLAAGSMEQDHSKLPNNQDYEKSTFKIDSFDK